MSVETARAFSSRAGAARGRAANTGDGGANHHHDVHFFAARRDEEGGREGASIACVNASACVI